MNKYIKPISIFFIISLTIIACHSIATVDRQSLKTGSTAITKSPIENNVVEIWWDKGFNPEEDEALQELVNNWEKQTGNKIKLAFYGTDELFQKVERELHSGDLPDLIAMFKGEKSLTTRLAWEGKLADLSEVIEPIQDIYTEDILKTANLYNNVEQKLSYYALPIHQATMHIYYWRDLLEQVGYTDQDIPQEWDAFWQFWTKVQDELKTQENLDIYSLGLPLSIEAGDTYQTFEQILEAYNISILDPTGKLTVDNPQTRQGIIKVLDWYDRFYQQGYMPPSALHWLNPDNNRHLLNRSVVMTTNDTLSIPAAVRQDPDTYRNKMGILELPNKPNGEPMNYLVTVQQAILLAESDNLEAAKDFLAYIIQPDINGKFLKIAGGRHSPVLKPVWQDSFWTDKNDPHVSTATHTFTKQPTRIYYTYQNPAYSIVLKENVWGNALRQVLVEDVPKEQAADEAIIRIKQIFAEWES
ncbi:MAG: ABC transporter substrate-binding protein [Xenococcaceae cyanobacterium MO_188.B29]|nr:ABC transporter substrate-binding protein [Xenococcaceae cyanobacterium MO_188.B29]